MILLGIAFMTISIKVAKTPQECSDVYQLRYQVYCVEENYFSSRPDGKLTDPVDQLDSVSNVLVYIDGQAVGTIRVAYTEDINRLSHPPEDFEEHRKNLLAENPSESPTLISAGMLAISKPWRKRPEILFGLFRMATELGIKMGGSHVTALVNEKTLNLYKRLNWSVVGERVWLDEAQEFCYPLITTKQNMLAIASGTKRGVSQLLETLVADADWLIVESGDTLFRQGDKADAIYLINVGEVQLSYQDESNQQTCEPVTLKKGDILGHEGLSDLTTRQYTGQITKTSELFVIERSTLMAHCEQKPELYQALISLLSRNVYQLRPSLAQPETTNA